MRGRILSFVSIAGLAAAGLAFTQMPALAQSATTTDDIICKMSGTCGEAAATGEKQAVGDEKMFSLQKPAAGAKPAQQQTGPEKMFSLQARPAATPAASTAPAVKATKKKAARAAAPASSSSELTMQVNFMLGSADLTDGAKEELTKYVAAMQSPQLSAMTFVIEGHTDASGAYQTNMDLSQRRAQSVVDFLVSQGVAAERLKAEGLGPNKPLPGVSKKSASQRRVELVRAS